MDVLDKFSACAARGRSTDALPRAYRLAAVSAPTAREQSAPTEWGVTLQALQFFAQSFSIM